MVESKHRRVNTTAWKRTPTQLNTGTSWSFEARVTRTATCGMVSDTTESTCSLVVGRL